MTEKPPGRFAILFRVRASSALISSPEPKRRRRRRSPQHRCSGAPRSPDGSGISGSRGRLRVAPQRHSIRATAHIAIATPSSMESLLIYLLCAATSSSKNSIPLILSISHVCYMARLLICDTAATPSTPDTAA
ncbi:hypothetical protein VTN00DRAFT_6423 [Thermoascus crustaceus]|uniref:uncharacterized protein n=1 Tax=Thermoascus crustaceus TaxID=5088 RepID=UPI0037448BCC